MLNKKDFLAFSGLILAVALLPGGAFAASQAGSEQQPALRHRTSPLYATSRQGAPVTGLTAADLEVRLGGRPVSDFTLTRGNSQGKLLFLVFDTASLGSNALTISKKVARATVERAGEGVRFVVMSVDPGSGLRLICGPTAERETAAAAISASVVSKIWSHALDSSGINRVATPAPAQVRKDDRQIGPVIIGSLRALSAILGRFTESDKVVHFYSGGIPEGTMVERSAIPSYTGYGVGPVYSSDPGNFTSPETETYHQIMDCGRAIRKSGAVLFAIDAAGAVMGEAEAISGEPSLRMLVSESGGRYFEGPEKALGDSLEEIERGYYQLGIPLSTEVGDAGVSVEIRPKSPDITLTSGSTLLKTRTFADMPAADQGSVIAAIVSDRLVGDVGLTISGAPAEISGTGSETRVSVRLPVGSSQAEWDIYKVWLDTAKGTFQMEKEHVLSESPYLTFGMAAKEKTIQGAVLVQAGSGVALVCRGAQKSGYLRPTS